MPKHTRAQKRKYMRKRYTIRRGGAQPSELLTSILQESKKTNKLLDDIRLNTFASVASKNHDNVHKTLLKEMIRSDTQNSETINSRVRRILGSEYVDDMVRAANNWERASAPSQKSASHSNEYENEYENDMVHGANNVKRAWANRARNFAAASSQKSASQKSASYSDPYNNENENENVHPI